MPLRLLMYVGLLYEKWVKMFSEEKFLHSTKLLSLPRPEFAVFYNGTTKRPDKHTLSLSTAFESSNNDAMGSLELKVPIYNINKGMNSKIMGKSLVLEQYSHFVAKLREFRGTCKSFDDAVRETITYCINNGILVEFLRKNGGKIVSILSMEYDEDAAKRVYAQEQVEDKSEEIAQNLLKQGLTVSSVSDATGVIQNRVLELQKNLSDAIPAKQTIIAEDEKEIPKSLDDQIKEEKSREIALTLLKENVDIGIIERSTKMLRENLIEMKEQLTHTKSE